MYAIRSYYARQVLTNIALELIVEEEYPHAELTGTLLQLGYQPVPLVEERGSFAVRGDIMDLFPPDTAQPYRLDFYGDWIEKIRSFDPATQRSGEGTFERIKLRITSYNVCYTKLLRGRPT